MPPFQMSAYRVATDHRVGVNGRRLTLTNDQAYELVMSVASGEVDDVAGIAERIRHATEPR